MRRTIWITLAAGAALACTASTESPTFLPRSQTTATPVLSPAPGTYASSQTVTITSATAGSTVHCTRDGSIPTAASPTCADPISVTSTTTLQAVATAPGYLDSDIAGGTYTIQADATPAATPTFSPDPAVVYTAAVAVTVSSATAGATVHCTTDGSAATASSPTCAAPITVSATTTIHAVATAPGHTASGQATATYTIQTDATPAATPTFSPDPAVVYTAAVAVTVSSATAGATLHCTTDGSAATAASPTCATPVTVSATTTIHAVATAPGHTASGQAAATYTIQTARAGLPTFSPPAGTYASAQSVTISSATPGATIHCTTNGSTATASSPTCSAPVAVSATTTLRAVATAPGFATSQQASALYTIQGIPQAARPTFSPPGGTYPSAQTVTISSTTSGATVHCTTDGTPATATSPACSAPVEVAATTTIRAVATASGFTTSPEALANYTIGGLSDFDCALALSTSRQFFGHQSVGNNILYGPADGSGGGLDSILSANSAAHVRVVNGPSSLSPGDWGEEEIGTNGAPSSKVDAFNTILRTRFGGRFEFAALKFCFVDFREGATDVASAWAHYQSVMDALQVSYPGRIVYLTVPLMPDTTDIADNAKREEMSNHIRTTYGPTGRVFDLADLEAHDAAGHPVTLGGVPAMSTDWSADGHYDGHLNQAGAHRIALAYLHFMCNLKRSQ